MVDEQGLDTVLISMWGEGARKDICFNSKIHRPLRSQRSSKRVNTGFHDQKQSFGGKVRTTD